MQNETALKFQTRQPNNELETLPQVLAWVDMFSSHLEEVNGSPNVRNRIAVEFAVQLQSKFGLCHSGHGAGLAEKLKNSPQALKLGRDFRFERCCLLQFAKPLWPRATKQQRVEVVAHELGHAYAWMIYGELGHDQYWRKIMSDMGMSDEVFHHVPLKAMRTAIVCENCGQVHEVTQRLMNRRLNKGVQSVCARCKHPVVLYRKSLSKGK